VDGSADPPGLAPQAIAVHRNFLKALGPGPRNCYPFKVASPTTLNAAPLPLVDDAIGPVASDPDTTRRYLALIAAATDRLMGADDPARMIEALFELIRDELRLDLFFNFRRDADDIRLEACGGLSPAQRRAMADLDIAGSLCARAMRERRVLHLTDIQHSDDPAAAFVRSIGVKAYLCMPLFYGEQLLGTLSFGRRAAGPFTDEEQRLLSLLCHYVSLAKHRLRIEQALREGIETQTRLLDEVNHRVRNALQVAIGLVTNEVRAAADPRTRAALGRAAERLQVLASAHRPLYATAEPGLVDLAALFGDVIGQLRGDEAPPEIAAPDAIAVPIERAVAAALLLDTMLEAQIGVPRIHMTTRQIDGNEMLRISFDGVGWERGVDLVGTDRLVARLCHQLRATLTSEGSGCLILVMPHDGGEHRHGPAV